MPFRKYPNKRRPRRRRLYKKRWVRRAPAPSSGITRPRVMRFKRSEASQLILNSSSAPPHWTAEPVTGALYSQFTTNLDEVPDNAEFKALFEAYKIKGVRIQGYLSNTGSDGYNQQIMLYWNQNWQGTSTANLSEQFFLDRPRSKRRILLNSTGKLAFDIYQPVRQLSLMYGGAVNNDYGTVKPRWISTTEGTTMSYGFNLRLARVDNQPFTSGSTFPYPSIKLVTTWYLEMRGVS